MRLVLVFTGLLLALSQIGGAQTASALDATYGHFDGKSYKVTPDVHLTVTYGSDQRAFFDTEIADRVINQITPAGVREGVPKIISAQMGCASATIETYANVGISLANACGDLGKTNMQNVQINWKRAACR